MSKTISILGTGWLGLPLAKHLLSKGYQVKGSTTSEHKIQQFTDLGIQPYLIDILNDDIEEENKVFFDTDILIITIPPKRDIERYTSQMNAIAKAIKNNQIEHLIYTSSTGVYGASIGLTNEDTEIQPIKTSSKAVAKAEKILSDLNKNRLMEYFSGVTVFSADSLLRNLVGERLTANGRCFFCRKPVCRQAGFVFR